MKQEELESIISTTLNNNPRKSNNELAAVCAKEIVDKQSDSGEQQPVTEELVKQAITDFVFEVAKFGKFKHQPYGAILLEVGLWVSENKWLQNKLTQPPTSEPGNVVTGELYWKQRCLASEEIYRLLNLGLVHSKEYLVWEKLKNQEVEPGQQNQDELFCDRLLIEYGNDKDAVTDFGDKAIIDWLISKYLLIKKDK